MDTSQHTLPALFAQLGLDNDPSAIDSFIENHRGLQQERELADADFWSPSQAAFLREAVADDADWAEIVDQLDALLRH